MTEYLLQAFIYLVAAVIAVPIAKRLGLGSVLGYLLAGIVIGPVIGLVGSETTTIQHFAEFGVVMMLFLVGLELEPKMLWSMRNKLMGLGGLQLGLTTAAIFGIAWMAGLPWTVALTVGLLLSLSSTAIVLQTFNEKGLDKSEGGRNAFSVLLFQDIAVIPMLALIPLLALPELLASAEAAAAAAEHHPELSLVAGLPTWAYTLVIIAAIAGLVVGGHYLSRPLFAFVSSAGLREIFTAAALMLVIGIAALMGLIGLSAALGTFLAGVVLANSEFRHELEASIEPFKGLLLGLFFITVGAGIDFGIFAEYWWQVLLGTLGLMLLKGVILGVIGFVFRFKGADAWLFALSLAQAGEFGFVLLSFGQQNAVISAELAAPLSLLVALSMLFTPALFIAFDKWVVPRYQGGQDEREADDIGETGQVIIAGIGRFGQIVNRLLVANGVPTTVLDNQYSQVDTVRLVNMRAYYGDASEPDLLHTAGIEHARLLVVAIDNQERAVEIVHHVKRHHPKVKVLARAFDRGHGYQLRQAGADMVISETYHSALEVGRQALDMMGTHPFHSHHLKHTFAEHEANYDDKLFDSWANSDDEAGYTLHYQKLFVELEEALSKYMGKDRSQHDLDERSWTPPPKDYLDDFEAPAEESADK
ncbi:monovalent cation:proton antiporter-2 (CPA2) family protein [Paraferrimonas sedimenticola]|uniref:Potassium transporter n=1 Tax=Paraferrimonas sedimenticola TaxID=375674 RepID=A0AA37RV93_9GAMM|nr:monovalent cation:proton antiporter-2 (CPA2) family protein [Paraferrimonas sedimenticola]GLP95474.1 potassium transporter [Paraferrimonas sedimenticola]